MVEFNATEVLAVGGAVVPATEIVKFSKFVPEERGMSVAGVLSALFVLAYAYSQPTFEWSRFQIWPVLTAYIAVWVLAGGVYGFVRAARGADVTNASPKLIVALLLPSLVLAGCANRKPLVLVAQSGQTAATSIGTAARGITSLQQGGVLTPRQALDLQRKLDRANDTLKPLPDLLIAIDAATQAGQTDAQRIDAALAILRAVGVEVDAVIGGLPVGAAAADVLKLLTEARRLMDQIRDALARRIAGWNVMITPEQHAAMGGVR